MVETLFFDLDNTLLDFNRAERAAIAKTLKSFHIAPEPSVLKRYSELNLAQWKLLEQRRDPRADGVPGKKSCFGHVPLSASLYCRGVMPVLRRKVSEK